MRLLNSQPHLSFMRNVLKTLQDFSQHSVAQVIVFTSNV